MANFLGPAWVQIKYHGQVAPHTMTIPTLAWNDGPDNGTFDAWVGGTVDATDMVTALVTLMLPFFNSDTQFDNFEIFTRASDTDPIIPRRSDTFSALVGTDTSASWAGAVEVIMIARTTLFGIAKLSLLDAVSDDNFLPITSLSGRYLNLMTEWALNTNGWSGRDNGRPLTFLKATKNLNQKLRKEYRYD
jgi:hypothetical protein